MNETALSDKPRRAATLTRATRETKIELSLDLDGAGRTEIHTGIGFLDHLLTALAFHARFDVSLACHGDLDVDDHHTAEDCAIALGGALDQALGERSNIARFGWASVPMDEALAEASIDLVRRPFAVVDLSLRRERIGELSCENIPHVLQSLATAGDFTLHCNVRYGQNDHHKAEAAFKAVALALRQAVSTSATGLPSTKGAM
jgi:imidazoleglycerol phosphate dehydratase HisB